MKIKTIILSAITVILVFIIYLTSIDKQIYYLNLGDNVNEEYNYSQEIENYLTSKQKFEKKVEFVDLDYRTTDLIRDINDNKNIIINGKKQTLKNALIKADLVTLSIGKNDIYYKINNPSIEEIYDYVDEVLGDIKKLLIKIREYCKEDIIFIGIIDADTNYPEIINYTNEKLKQICNNQNIQFIDINKTVSNEAFLVKQLKGLLNKTILK